MIAVVSKAVAAVPAASDAHEDKLDQALEPVLLTA